MSREGIIMRCTICKHENYITKKNKKTKIEKLLFKKYCSNCKKHEEHKEKK